MCYTIKSSTRSWHGEKKTGRTRRRAPFAHSLKLIRLVQRHVVDQRVGRVAGVVVVVAGERERVAVAGGDGRRGQGPGGGGARLGDHVGGGAGGVVLQGGQRPVVGDRVGAGLLVEERERGGAR